MRVLEQRHVEGGRGLEHLPLQHQPPRGHGGHHPGDGQVRVDAVAAQQGDGGAQVAQALQGQELRLQRHQHAAGRGQRVDGQDAQVGRRVHQHHLVLPGHRGQRLAQVELLGRGLGQARLEVAQAPAGRHQVERRPRARRARRSRPAGRRPGRPAARSSSGPPRTGAGRRTGSGCTGGPGRPGAPGRRGRPGPPPGWPRWWSSPRRPSGWSPPTRRSLFAHASSRW